MTPERFVQQLAKAQEYFERSTSALTEADADFAPVDGTFSVKVTVAHVAQVVDWLFEGAFRPEGFSMDLEAAQAEVEQVPSLAEARAWIGRAFQHAREVIGAKSEAELDAPLPEGPIMGGEPRAAILAAIEDHTAHHRGALAVVARLRGHRPPMPYMDA